MTDNAAKHPYRLTYTKMTRRPIPSETPVGLNRNARGSRRRWHVLDHGAPICGQVPAENIGERTIWGLLSDEEPCDRCHHELSWAPMPHDVEERDLGYSTPCWVWVRGLDNDGYGERGRRGKHTATHRDAYAQAFGDPPDGWIVHHKCGQTACMNPSHLEAMSRADHIRLHRPERYPGSAALKRKP